MTTTPEKMSVSFINADAGTVLALFMSITKMAETGTLENATVAELLDLSKRCREFHNLAQSELIRRG